MKLKDLDNKKIGFSHGALHKLIDIYSKAAIDIYKSYSKDALELSLVRREGIDKVRNIIPHAKDIVYKSIHLPSDVVYKNDADTIKILDEVAIYYKELEADLVLLHPDVVEDWKVFDAYPFNWAIENMDSNHSVYTTVDQLEVFFKERPNWKFVLDLNHCYSNDRTMKLAKDFIARLGNRLAEVHLSGYEVYHEPLFRNDQDIIIEQCKDLAVPIIIESTFDNLDDIGKEFDYISKYLMSSR
jgi:hypothetical protein